ncbi:MAG: hypothetical protein ACTSVD_03855, partial [Candidatus Thorarchaeota archaeon]
PQDSSYGYRSSGYIYSSSRKTAELCWGPFQGGYGAVYASIDGQSDGYPIAECDNASRVIKYVAILGYCNASYDVVEMRVHDIRVIADLNRHDPTAPDPDAPAVSDHTNVGFNPCDEAMSFAEVIADMVAANTICWWSGWWPVLHTRTSGTLDSGATYEYQIAIDVLGSATLETMFLQTPLDDDLDETGLQTMVDEGIDEFLQEAFPVELAALYAAQIIMFAIDVLLHRMKSLPTPGELAILGALLVSYTAAMFLVLYATWDGVVTHRIGPAAAFGALFGIAITLLGEGYFSWVNAGSVWSKWWRCRGMWYGTGFRARWYCILSVLVISVKVLFLGIVFAMMIRCWELWLSGW